jgi:hypothetical protein
MVLLLSIFLSSCAGLGSKAQTTADDESKTNSIVGNDEIMLE